MGLSMSTSFDNASQCRVPPPWLWSGRTPVRWQAIIVILATAILFAIVDLFAPELGSFAKQVLGTWAHETGHYVTAKLTRGEVTEMVVTANQGGHVLVRSQAPLQSVLVSAMGILFPAIVSAWFFHVGLTRRAMHMSLLLFAMMISFITYINNFEPSVTLVLYGWALLCLVAALIPADAIFAAVACVVVAVTLFLGIVDKIDYVFLDYINGDAGRPSDSQSIANALGSKNLQEVGNSLVSLMISIYAISFFLIVHWFHRHR